MKLTKSRECDQEIAARHQGLRLSLNPALALKVLTVRAIAVPTGMWHHALLATVATLGQHAEAQHRTTVLHGIQGLALTGQCAGAVLRKEGWPKALNEGGKRDHLTTPQSILKRLIKASMRALAWSLVWLLLLLQVFSF